MGSVFDADRGSNAVPLHTLCSLFVISCSTSIGFFLNFLGALTSTETFLASYHKERTLDVPLSAISRAGQAMIAVAYDGGFFSISQIPIAECAAGHWCMSRRCRWPASETLHISGHWRACSTAHLHLAISSCEDFLVEALGFLNVENGFNLAIFFESSANGIERIVAMGWLAAFIEPQARNVRASTVRGCRGRRGL